MSKADLARWRDEWDGARTISCPKCGEVARRIPTGQVENTHELVGLTCKECGHPFDYVAPEKQ